MYSGFPHALILGLFWCTSVYATTWSSQCRPLGNWSIGVSGVPNAAGEKPSVLPLNERLPLGARQPIFWLLKLASWPAQRLGPGEDLRAAARPHRRRAPPDRFSHGAAAKRTGHSTLAAGLEDPHPVECRGRSAFPGSCFGSASGRSSAPLWSPRCYCRGSRGHAVTHTHTYMASVLFWVHGKRRHS